MASAANNRIADAQRGVAYADSYAASIGQRARVPRSRGGPAAAVLSGPFLAPGSLTRAERRRTIDAILRVIEGVYTHLPLKRARYAFDPVQRLRILRGQAETLSDDAFHIELADILTRLRDAHTRYVGPASLEDVSAVLPFFVEMIGDADNASYVVTQVTADLARSFQPGVIVAYWNGVPIDLAVQRWSEHEVGGRPDSQRAAAVLSLTMRSLQYGAPPDEHWVIVGYFAVDGAGEPTGPLLEVRAPWRIVIPKKAAQRTAKAAKRADAQALRRSVNPAAEAVRRAKMLMFAPASLTASTQKPSARKRASIASQLPQTLRTQLLPTPDGPVAVLRIWAFDSEPEPYLAELRRLLPLLPQEGLIIDVRGNPGGYIEAAERSLQFFTPGPITPTRFSVLATPMTRLLAETPGLGRDELAPWRESLEAAVRNGELYSRPLPITRPEDCNDIGQLYGGPVVLVADASTYSSGDLFSAGFVDNAIGPFVCVGDATGAGGANVWDYADLRTALAGTPEALPLLPDGIGLTVSFRRATRGGPSEGLPIEDAGVAGTRYAMTRADLLDGNRDLLAHAIALLRKQALTRLAFERLAPQRTLRLTTRGIDRLDAAIDGNAVGSIKPRDGQPVDLPWPAGAQRIELRGSRRGILMQRRLIDLSG